MQVTRKYAIAASLTFALALLVLLAFAAPQPALAQYNTACYKAQTGALWACGSGGTLQLGSGSTLDVQAGATANFATNLTMSDGNLTIADYLAHAKQTAITVTTGIPITPTGTYQPITAAGSVTATGVAPAAAGAVLILTNTSANNIQVDDTGTLKLAGNAVLGQYDTLELLSDGTNWLQIAKSDN